MSGCSALIFVSCQPVFVSNFTDLSRQAPFLLKSLIKTMDNPVAKCPFARYIPLPEPAPAHKGCRPKELASASSFRLGFRLGCLGVPSYQCRSSLCKVRRPDLGPAPSPHRKNMPMDRGGQQLPLLFSGRCTARRHVREQKRFRMTYPRRRVESSKMSAGNSFHNSEPFRASGRHKSRTERELRPYRSKSNRSDSGESHE